MLFEDLLLANAIGERTETIAMYSEIPLLIIDDLGMRKLPANAAEDLLEIVMRRYERTSTILTSNRPLDDWPQLFGDMPAVAAFLDRLMHHSHLIEIRGKSYRLHEHSLIQGVRSYNPALGGWTTPDSYTGSDYDPTSLQSYLWNGNNPIGNVDPSGYCTSFFIGGGGWGYSNTCSDADVWGPFLDYPDTCDPAADVGCTGGGPKGTNPPPVCAQGAYGAWICQDANYNWSWKRRRETDPFSAVRN